MLRRRAATSLLAVPALTLGLIGCSVQLTDAPREIESSSSAIRASTPPGSLTGAHPTPSPSSRYRNYGVSEAFPLPVDVRAFVYRDRVTRKISGVIPVADAAAAYRYWVLRMPQQGYVVDDSDFLDGYGHIRAHGHGCASPYGDATVRLTFIGVDDVQYSCEP